MTDQELTQYLDWALPKRIQIGYLLSRYHSDLLKYVSVSIVF